MSHETQPRFMEIHEEFAKTTFGHTLAGRVRYERYKPHDVSNERWIDLLGADVNNLTHMPLTYGLARNFIRVTDELQPGYLSDEEGRLLQVAALIHDWAESIVGDISFGDKTSGDEVAEQAAFEANMSRFYHGDLTLVNKARTEIVFDHTGKSKLGRIFNAVERVGYMRTALRAAEHIAAGDASDCDSGLRWLVADVLTQQPRALIRHAETLQPIWQYLGNQQTTITNMFKLVEESTGVFENYIPEQRESRRLQFYDSYAAWEQWCAQHGSASC